MRSNSSSATSLACWLAITLAARARSSASEGGCDWWLDCEMGDGLAMSAGEKFRAEASARPARASVATRVEMAERARIAECPGPGLWGTMSGYRTIVTVFLPGGEPAREGVEPPPTAQFRIIRLNSSAPSLVYMDALKKTARMWSEARETSVALRETFRIALDTLRAHKLRTFLTLLGVILAVTTLVAVMSVLNGLNVYVADKVANLGANAFVIDRIGIITNFDEWV